MYPARCWSGLSNLQGCASTQAVITNSDSYCSSMTVHAWRLHMTRGAAAGTRELLVLLGPGHSGATQLASLLAAAAVAVVKAAPRLAGQ